MDLAAVLSRRLVHQQRQLDASTDTPAWRREELWGTAEALLVHSNPVFEHRVGRYAVLSFEEDHAQIAHRVWDGAMVLGHALRRLREGGFLPGEGVVVLELGAGTGAASMIAAVADEATSGRCEVESAPRAAAPWRFLATDIPLAVPHCERCVARNGLSHAVRTQALAWGDAGHAAAAQEAVAALRAELSSAAAPAAARSSTSRACQPPRPGLPDFLVASDLAAPLACVAPLLATLAEFMPPPAVPPTGPGVADAWLAARLETWLATAPPGPPPLPAPFLIITCQVAREFTAALIPALRGAGYGAVLLPPAGLDPAFESPRHETYAVAAPPPGLP